MTRAHNHQFSNKKACLIIILAVFLIISTSTAKAQVFQTLNDFNYGEIIVLKNDAQYDYTVGPQNSSPLTFDPSQFTVLTGAVRARFRLTGAPGNTALNISVSATDVLKDGVGPEMFEITDLEIRPNNPQTNGAGRRVIRIGSTLRTSGDGTFYYGGSYTGMVDVTVSW